MTEDGDCRRASRDYSVAERREAFLKFKAAEKPGESDAHSPACHGHAVSDPLTLDEIQALPEPLRNHDGRTRMLKVMYSDRWGKIVETYGYYDLDLQSWMVGLDSDERQRLRRVIVQGWNYIS
jgi:hypothetical protein